MRILLITNINLIFIDSFSEMTICISDNNIEPKISSLCLSIFLRIVIIDMIKCIIFVLLRW